MSLLALDIPPGIYRNGTDYQARGRYHSADLMRFFEGTIRPIGGWERRSLEPMQGKARAMVTWRTNAGQAWTAVATHTHLYAVSRSGAVNDVSPIPYPTGQADAVFGGGYGEGLYSAGTYGTPREGSTNILPASVWSLDTWGEYLVGTMGEVIYQWVLNTSIVAQPLTNAPDAAAILVTDERIMMALGSDGDPRAVDWCDAEDNTDWTPSATNLAGGKRLQTNGGLLAGRRVNGANLLWTDVDVHRASYVGLPFVYAFERLETGCGVVSKGAVAVGANGRAYWFGDNGFWTYNGYVDDLPCDVQDYVFSDLNRTQISKVTAWHNSTWGEIWWHYPSADSDENDRYVKFNYREGHWNIGELVRLSGADKGVLQYPQMMGDDGWLYSHETGSERDGRAPFLTSGPVELGEGDRTMEVHAVVPDERNLGDVLFSFSAADYPEDAPINVAAVPAAAKTDVRFSARKVAVTMTALPDIDFRIGRVRFDVKPGSGR